MGLVQGRVAFWTAVVWLCAAMPAVAVEATLVADAHVNSAQPAVNSGAISNLNVGGGYTSLVQFDLSSLPAGTTAAQISKATLRLYCNRVDTAGAVSVEPVNGAWGEHSVTYVSLPALGSVAATAQVSQAGEYVTVDVTSLVQGWVADPTTNNGVALTATTASVEFDSKENDLTGHAAELDVTLTSTGATGPVGPQGATGQQGPQGSAGANGPQGVTGATGPQGIEGPAGPTGPQGLQGPAGPQGPQGPPGPGGGAVTGLTYRGTYSSTATYAMNDFVSYMGSSYLSVLGGNMGNIPGPTSLEWALLAQGGSGLVGPQGPVGPQGLQGLTGAQGPVGPQGAPGAAGAPGANGANGTPGLVYRGVYASTTGYAQGDVVFWQGASYASLVAGNLGNSPSSSPADWGALTAQGPAGPQGIQGVAGLQGPPGATGPTGAAGAQGLQGAPGQAGAQGVQGPPGAAGMNFRGPWNSVAGYMANDAVTFGGSTYLALMGSLASEPDTSPAQWTVLAAKGVAGPTGPAGVAATVSIGMVTTGVAGTQASVTNSGTVNAAVLNFTIPQGSPGANGTGSGGGGGGETSGIPFASMYHAVSFSTTYYSVNNSSASAAEGQSVLTWVPSGCTATSLVVYSTQTNTITVTLRQGTAGNMADTTLACSAASGASCTAMGSVAVVAGSFVDLSIGGANGTANGVWTALACN